MTSKNSLTLLVLALVSTGIVVILFLLSEKEIHRNNAFVRRYPHHPVNKVYDLPITYNSYYISGRHHHKLYLGNSTAPLHLLEVNLKTKDTQHISITLEPKHLRFHNLQVQLQYPYFFVSDGTTPCIFRGLMEDWKAKLWMEDLAYFDKAIPLDSNTMVISTIDSKSQTTTLGRIFQKNTGEMRVTLRDSILEKQIDGVFDVDGIMTATSNGKTLSYAYFYRNQFIIMDSQLAIVHRQRTIDTVQNAQLDVAILGNNSKQIAAPTLTVNKMAAINQDLIFINSTRIGKYEEAHMLKEAAIIDVYNWKKATYEFSFYIYNVNGDRLKNFTVIDNYVVGLIGNTLSVYEMDQNQFKRASLE